MKILLSFLGTSLMAVGIHSATPTVTNAKCQCQSCACTQERHCGCFSKEGCKCGERCQCGDVCSCGSNCSSN